MGAPNRCCLRRTSERRSGCSAWCQCPAFACADWDCRAPGRGSLANRLPLPSGVLAHERGSSARLLASGGDGGIGRVCSGTNRTPSPGLRGSTAPPAADGPSGSRSPYPARAYAWAGTSVPEAWPPSQIPHVPLLPMARTSPVIWKTNPRIMLAMPSSQTGWRARRKTSPTSKPVSHTSWRRGAGTPRPWPCKNSRRWLAGSPSPSADS
jgi:hypothetical protein